MHAEPTPPEPAASPAAGSPATVPGDRRLWAELLRRARRGQEARRRSTAGAIAGTTVGTAAERAGEAAVGAADGTAGELSAVDADNSGWLADIVARRGWPGWSLVGQDGAMAAWLLAQHADAFPERQQALLTALAEAVDRGEASAAQQAYLEDRVRVNAGLPQRFGTRFSVTAGGEREPFPVEDPDGLADRRAAAGLPPLR